MRFADMLRQAREAKGLTQAELGDGAYSSRFISLLERGQRQPTPAMVQHFAARLGMDVQTLNWWVEAPSTEDEPGLTLAVFAANFARDMRDNELAAAEAEHAANIAYEQRCGPAWWLMCMLQTRALMDLRRLEQAEAALRKMETSALMPPSAQLRIPMTLRLSSILRNTGRLLEAVDLAREALEAAAELPEHAAERLQAAFILIAALSVKGDLDEAWAVATGLDLQAISSSVPSPLIARGAWAIGNVAFRRGDTELGSEHHALAAQLFLPQADLQTWADFHRASAAYKLHAGLTDESVRHSLDNAELGLQLVGTERQRLELVMARAQFALLTSDLTTAGTLLETLTEQRALLDFESQTELEEFLGQFHAASSAPELARRHLAEAARLFEEAGADEKARELLDRADAIGT